MVTLRLEGLSEPESRKKKLDWPVIGEHALFDWDGCTIRVVAVEDWEWGSLNLEFDCDGPPEGHWLYWEMDALCNLAAVLGVDGSGPFLSRLEEQLLREGVAPGQPFTVDMTYYCNRDPYSGEYDSEVDWRVVTKEPLSQEEASERWEALIGRKHTLIG